MSLLKPSLLTPNGRRCLMASRSYEFRRLQIEVPLGTEAGSNCRPLDRGVVLQRERWQTTVLESQITATATELIPRALVEWCYTHIYIYVLIPQQTNRSHEY